MNHILQFFEELIRLMGDLPAIGVTSLTFFVLLILPFLIKITLKSASPSFWQVSFVDYNTSPIEFYAEVREKIKEQNIPRIRQMRTVLKPEGGFFSPRRKYYRIKRKQHAIYVGATPFGKSYVFSWHIFPRISLFRFVVYHIPLVGKLLISRSKKDTFYRNDTDYAFYSIIHRIVLDEVERRTEGIRVLDEDERKPIMTNIFRR